MYELLELQKAQIALCEAALEFVGWQENYEAVAQDRSGQSDEDIYRRETAASDLTRANIRLSEKAGRYTEAYRKLNKGTQ